MDQQKRRRLRIGTHNGSFHCDESLACWLLLQTNQFRDAEIIRSRDPNILNDLDVLVDVGAVYDPEKFRFDHHQITFTGTLTENHKIRLSSAGLVYKHFGREIIASLLGIKDDKLVELLFFKIYKNFIEALDGIDNGVNQYDVPSQDARYTVSTDLSARVGKLNPWWNEPQTDEILLEKFHQAVELTGKEFTECVMYFGKSWLPARTIVEEAVNGRFQIDPSGSIIKLNHFCPWKDHLWDIEQELNIGSAIKFVLFEDTNKSWRVQCVSLNVGSFSNRKDLLWKGLRDDELSKASGIDGGIFVHASGFIGGNKTYAGALAMAQKSLNA